MCVQGCKQVVSSKLSRRHFLRGATAAVTAAAVPIPAALSALPSERRPISFQNVVDLTHTFRAGFPVYTFEPPTRTTVVTVEENGFYSQEWTFAEHSGTHMDAPGHFVADGRRTPQIQPEELITPLVVVDIRDKAAADPDALVTLGDIRAWERRYGRIPSGSCVAMLSGWEQYIDDPEAFLGVDENGVYHFPGFGLDAVDFLLERRDIQSIAVDTLSLDHGPSTSFEVHLRLLGADRYGLENVANLGQMPARGGTLLAAVIPWEEGSGGPCRILGFTE